MKGIYKFTNKINKKIYIGKSQNLEKRYQEHKRNFLNSKIEDYNTKFYRALRKYGFDNFSYEIIEQSDNFTNEQLNEKEKYYIKLYDSVNNGYNTQAGGLDTAVARKLTEIQIIEIKELLLKETILLQDIAKKYNISKSLVTMINKGITWNNIGNYTYPIRKNTINNTGESNPKAKITDKEVLALREYFVNHTLNEVYDKFGQNYSFSEIKKICYGCQFTHLPVYKKK